MFRIGIAIGDVMEAETGDLLGDGVNIAARLEGIAAPGGICVSEEVRTHVHNKIDIGAVDLGEQQLKNIPRPVRAFRLSADPQDAPPPRKACAPAGLGGVCGGGPGGGDRVCRLKGDATAVIGAAVPAGRAAIFACGGAAIFATRGGATRCGAARRRAAPQLGGR